MSYGTREIEIINHSIMDCMNIFFVEMASRTPHGHNDMEIGIVLEGNMQFFLDDTRYVLNKNDIYVIGRYQIHSFLSIGKPSLVLAFEIQESFYRAVNPRLHFLRVNKNVIRSNEISIHKVLMPKLFSCAKWYFSRASFHDLKCGAVMLDLFYELFQDRCCVIMSQKESASLQQNSARMNTLLEYISTHYMEPITLDTLSKIMNISTYYTSHYFQQNLGISFQEYLNNFRFQKAWFLVRHTDLKIMDICLETGFSSSRYLNQMFIKKLGMTVKEYRKAAIKPIPTIHDLPSENKNHVFLFEQCQLLSRRYLNR